MRNPLFKNCLMRKVKSSLRYFASSPPIFIFLHAFANNLKENNNFKKEENKKTFSRLGACMYALFIEEVQHKLYTKIKTQCTSLTFSV